MALWQVDFELVPRSVIAPSADPGTAALQDANSWAAVAFPSDYRTRLASVAAPATASNKEFETWGPEEGNRVEVWSTGGRVTRAMVRVDLRRLDSRFGAALLAFVRGASAVLVRRDGRIVEPNINEYAAALRSSDAWRFASDPAAFLASQSTSDDDDG
ncbi:MAG: hypothetical protein H7066_11910 [Cytophagaceae bacterium]|nr:hypothetical protein [Gemmatimonadaceae bacterium]